MKRILSSAIVVGLIMGGTAYAQQDDLAALKAELRKQQEIIAALMKKVEELESKQATAPSREELQQETTAQQERVTALEENLLGRVNLTGYYSFEYINEDSPAVGAFRQHQLAFFISRQVNRWNFFSEVEFEYAPAYDAVNQVFSRGNGGIKVERAWMEYSHNRYFSVRAGKQFFPTYWQVYHFPHLTLSTQRPLNASSTLFPREFVGASVYGTMSKPVGASEFGVGYNVYIANNQVPDDGRRDQRDEKALGGKVQLQFPVAGRLKKFDVAVDGYRGRLSNARATQASDTIWGMDTQLEIDRFLFLGEYARGNSLRVKRFGYYLQPAVRLNDELVAFYRAERVEDPQPIRGGTIGIRHLTGVNFRPEAQISLKLEYFRTLPRLRAFSPSDPRNKPSNGVATSAVYFF